MNVSNDGPKTLELPPLDIEIQGTVKHGDLHEAARGSLSPERYKDLVALFGEDFSATQLVDFVEDQHGTRD